MSSKNLQRKQVIRRVLEETGFAYTLNCECGMGNADYAEYASAQALDSFKRAFKNPELSYDDLCKMLRKATRRESKRSCKTPWSVFMANYLDTYANNDDRLGTVN